MRKSSTRKPALKLKDVRIYDAIEDEEGRPKRVLNKTDTMLAQQKQQVIKDAFANWIWQDPQRRIALVKQYNELFNSNRPREYDGSHIHFVGMNPEISLREHQRNAIAHVLYPHLLEVEQTAESRMQQTMQELLKQNPAPDKEQNQMSWVRHMNSLKAQAEELVLTELIYS